MDPLVMGRNKNPMQDNPIEAILSPEFSNIL